MNYKITTPTYKNCKTFSQKYITNLYSVDGGLLSMLELMGTHGCLSSSSVTPTTEPRQFLPLFTMVLVPMGCRQG